MALNLSEKTTFPDLRNWEDSDQKIAEAYKAIQELKAYLKQQDEEIRSEKEKKKRKNVPEWSMRGPKGHKRIGLSCSNSLMQCTRK